jgi:hypothetical protein
MAAAYSLHTEVLATDILEQVSRGADAVNHNFPENSGGPGFGYN